jgi:transcriptional regulator with XRE-family HTH domain
MAIGDRIKELRVRKGDSLQQVADAIGGSKAHIWELESNRSKNPSLDLLQKLATHFQTSIAYLIEEPAEDLTKAQQFLRRNGNGEKLGNLKEDQILIFENLLDMMAKKDGGR